MLLGLAGLQIMSRLLIDKHCNHVGKRTNLTLMRMRFAIDALAHIASLYSFIERHNRVAAKRIVAHIFVEADRLGDFPQVGRLGRVPDTRERTVPKLPYILVYEPGPHHHVVVLGVYHGAQDR